MTELNNNLRAIAVIAFAALCACGFIIGTFIAFASHPVEVWGVPVLGMLGIAATVFLLSTAVARQLWGGMKKVSIRRFVGKR